MTHHRKATMLAGVLIILSIIFGVFSVVPAVEQQDYLVQIAEHESQIIRGAFFQFLMIPAYVGFALCLYPFLKNINATLGLGFVGFRLITAMFHFIGVILLPLLLILSQQFVQAGTPDGTYFQTLGTLLRTGRDLVNHVAIILALSMGDLLLFWMFYRSKFIPRWLSLWGFIGIGLAMGASLLVLFRLTEVITALYLALNGPLALHNLALAAWLIIKGFDQTALDQEQAQQRSSQHNRLKSAS